VSDAHEAEAADLAARLAALDISCRESRRH
jgi:hypothetical protein